MGAPHAAFDLNSALKQYLDDPLSVPCSEACAELLEHEGDLASLNAAQLNAILDPIVDAMTVDPGAIATASTLDSLQCILKAFPSLPVQWIAKVLDIIISGLSAEADAAHQDIESDNQNLDQEHRLLLEVYGFLLQWAVSGLELRAVTEKSGSINGSAQTRKAKGKAHSGKGNHWDSTHQLQHALEVTCKVFKIRLLRLFVTTSERDTFISLFTRPVYLVLENEQRVKNPSIRMHVFKVLCMAIKHHGHAFGAQTSIVQNLSYFEHLSEPMAEFLQILSEQFDYPQLADEILRELSNKEFNSNDTKGPKSVSVFLVRLSELVPRLMIKQMTLTVKLLDSESYNLRSAVIEVCGNLITELANDDERSENSKAQMNAFFELLEERFLDVNPYCRCKALQVYHTKLLDLETKFPKRRQRVAELGCRSLEDKSSNVRKNAIKLMTKLVTTHPFAVLHGGTLKRSEWLHRLEVVENKLNALQAPMPEIASIGAGKVDQPLPDDTVVNEDPAINMVQEKSSEMAPAISQVDSEGLAQLQLTKRYYGEALRFIETMHTAAETICQLLGARNKSEVIEAMDFFQSIDAHKIEVAKVGIRKMLRLIWTKGNSDEGKGIQAQLVEVYKSLFFEAPETFTANETANFIARNMISLTVDATPAELTSLERLLSKMMAEGHISDLVIQKLWQIYGVQKREISRAQRRGAIIVLGMLAIADPDIVLKEVETILRIGLGLHGKVDLGLARFSCICLRHMSPVGRKTKDSLTSLSKLPNDHPILTRLAALVEMPSDHNEWFGLAEQALSAIYALSKHPDNLCTDIIRRKARAVFQSRALSTPQDGGLRPSFDENSNDASYFPLSQLLFIVGHVSVKQIVHLESCELDFKRRKGELEKAKESSASTKKPSDEQDELDLIGSTTEDDFTERMAHIRERELLYSARAILTNFGPLVAEICANNALFNDRGLQAQATLCMAKLMCVSSEYCEEHLPLLITIMERSNDPITRNNAVIALGDMAVCFNHLIDENTDFLYRRLNDSDPSVKRTCLMTLTFLILAGQVKVKGQLGEMAKCLEDSDRRIADLSRMFFSELATKDNAIYNHFVDMFSLLSAEEDLSEEAFRRILKFLASFIEKDKHAKQLSEKLAARLPRCETERHWNDVAYALSLLPHKNEEIQKLVAAGFRVVQTT